jgi:RimJ/RimL family protein N-acetyltransferase
LELTLRKVQKSDADFFVKELNKSKDYPKYLHVPYPYKKKDGLFWVNKCLKEYKLKKPASYSYIIILDKVPVGAISFNIIDYKNNNAQLGYWLAKKYFGQGIMQTAIKMIVYIAFEQLKLKRVTANVAVQNTGSQKVLLKNKFKKEGIMKSDWKYNDKYLDNYLFAKIRK